MIDLFPLIPFFPIESILIVPVSFTGVTILVQPVKSFWKLPLVNKFVAALKLLLVSIAFPYDVGDVEKRMEINTLQIQIIGFE
ncbi:hypothetical protein ACSBO6_09745 [Bacillus sp. AL-1R]